MHQALSALHFSVGTHQPVKVAAYCRVSTEEEIQAGSYETQMDFFEREIKSHPGWTLAGVYGDFGKSGTQIQGRKQFSKMMEDAQSGKIDVILSKSISRFARNTADCVQCIRTLNACGTRVYFLEQCFDTGDSFTELILTALSSIAEMESESLSETIKQTHQMMNSRGTPIIKAGYGYRYNRKTHEWHVDPAKKKFVHAIFWFAVNGDDLKTIVKKLQNMETTNYIWRKENVLHILTSEIYCGDLKTNKTCVIADQKGKRRIQNKGEADSYLIIDHHKPMISRTLSEEIRKLAENRQLAGMENCREGVLEKARQIAENDPLIADSFKKHEEGG